MVRSRQHLNSAYPIGVLCLFGMLGGCSKSDLSRIPIIPKPETPEEVIQPASNTKKVYRLGEPFAIRDEVTDVVISFAESRKSQGEEFLKPKENHYWFYLTGTVTNQSDNEFVISPDFYTLTDGQQKTYTPSVRSHALKGVKVLQGRIAPKSAQTAEIGFELPKGSKPVLLSFDISNNTACNDTLLKPTFFCESISIKLADE
jgi:hypothetical protein